MGMWHAEPDMKEANWLNQCILQMQLKANIEHKGNLDFILYHVPQPLIYFA